MKRKIAGGMPYNCRSCVTPLRLDRGSSRCISCCKSSEDLDCCHCDAKRHTPQTSNPLTADVDGTKLILITLQHSQVNDYLQVNAILFRDESRNPKREKLAQENLVTRRFLAFSGFQYFSS